MGPRVGFANEIPLLGPPLYSPNWRGTAGYSSAKICPNCGSNGPHGWFQSGSAEQGVRLGQQRSDHSAKALKALRCFELHANGDPPPTRLQLPAFSALDACRCTQLAVQAGWTAEAGPARACVNHHALGWGKKDRDCADGNPCDQKKASLACSLSCVLHERAQRDHTAPRLRKRQSALGM